MNPVTKCLSILLFSLMDTTAHANSYLITKFQGVLGWVKVHHDTAGTAGYYPVRVAATYDSAMPGLCLYANRNKPLAA